MLIGNKLDLINKKEKERQVTEEEAIKMCNQFNIIWGGEISVKEIEYNTLIELIKKFTIELYNKIGFKPLPVSKKLFNNYYKPRHRQIYKCIIY